MRQRLAGPPPFNVEIRDDAPGFVRLVPDGPFWTLQEAKEALVEHRLYHGYTKYQIVNAYNQAVEADHRSLPKDG